MTSRSRPARRAASIPSPILDARETRFQVSMFRGSLAEDGLRSVILGPRLDPRRGGARGTGPSPGCDAEQGRAGPTRWIRIPGAD